MKKFLLMVLILLVSTGTALAVPMLIDFEGVTNNYADIIPNGYAGMNWNNSAVTLISPEDPTATDDYSAFGLDYNPVEFSSTEFFTLESFFIGSGTQIPGMTFNVQGFIDGVSVFSEVGILPFSEIAGEYSVLFDGQINGVQIWADDLTFFPLIDDIVINTAAPVPEPPTMMLLGIGVMGIVGFRKLKIS